MKNFVKQGIYNFYLNRLSKSHFEKEKSFFKSVYYHRIHSNTDTLTKSPKEFEEDLKFYSDYFKCVTFHEFFLHLSGAKISNDPLLAITFDDGYKDNLIEAIPLLNKYSLPATFFVSTGFINTSREFPHDLKVYGNTRYFNKLTWNDLKYMQDLGFEIGSHTVNHLNLATLNKEELSFELKESLKMITENLGEYPRSISFPWGKPYDFNARIKDIALSIGYYCTASAYGGGNYFQKFNNEIKRFDAGNTNIQPQALKAKMVGFDPDYFRYYFRYYKKYLCQKFSF